MTRGMGTIPVSSDRSKVSSTFIRNGASRGAASSGPGDAGRVAAVGGPVRAPGIPMARARTGEQLPGLRSLYRESGMSPWRPVPDRLGTLERTRNAGHDHLY
jgi:hypothetical protein